MSEQAARQRFARRQLALRRMLLDARGNLTADARAIVADMRRFCHASAGQTLLKNNAATGAIDPYASVAAAARREVFDRYVRILNIDMPQITTASEED